MNKNLLFLLAIIGTLVTGCQKDVTINNSISNLPTPHVSANFLPTGTPILPTIGPTMNPTQTDERINQLLQGKEGCKAPCFMEITPRKTTRNEAMQIFERLGLTVTSVQENTNIYDTATYESSEKIKILISVMTDNDVVQEIYVIIRPEPIVMNLERKWIAFSQESILTVYGKPSDIRFLMDASGNDSTLSMFVYFDEYDLTIEYHSINPYTITQEGHRVCPLIDQQDQVRIWFGGDSSHFPSYGRSVDELTSLSEDEFVSLLTGDSTSACFFIDNQFFN